MDQESKKNNTRCLYNDTICVSLYLKINAILDDSQST